MAAVSSGKPSDNGHTTTEEWSSSEDAVQTAIRDDAELKMIASKLDTTLNIDPDRDLNIEVSGDTSDSDVRDSDSVSTGTASSLRDVTLESGSPDIGKSRKSGDSPSKTPSEDGESRSSGQDKKPREKSLKSSEKSLKSSPSVRSKTSVTSKSSGENGEKSKNPLKMLKKLTKFDKPTVKKAEFR